MTDSQVQAMSSDTQLVNNDSIVEYEFEDYYVDSYLVSRNKADSYKRACIATDYPIPKYPTQAAYSYHKRLDKEGKIEEALRKATLDSRIAAHNKMDSLRENATSENIQFQAAKHQTGDLYTQDSAAAGIEVHVNRDNVEITHKNQTLKIESK
jgi:hypothetical protein